MCDGVAAFGAERKLMFKVRSFRFFPKAAVSHCGRPAEMALSGVSSNLPTSQS